MNKLNQEYWENRYMEQQTGWDAGSITTPIKAYIDQLEDKSIKILVPGAGNAHEAIYLHEQGFNNVYVCDWATQPLNQLKNRCPNFPEDHLILEDFFKLEIHDFDLIIEQTFFCALLPNMRADYVAKMHQLLKQDAKLIGLLFQFPLTENGPPFGGNQEEYQVHFSKQFDKISIEDCYNSIKPRKGTELFIQIQRS